MMADEQPVDDDDLHAYVDERLPPDRRVRVEAYLGAHPEAAARIDGWRRGGDALRRVLQGKAQQPLPPSLDVKRLAAARPQRWTPQQMAAGLIVALLVGTGAGWWARGSDVPHGLAGLVQQAAMTERAFPSNSHLLHFAADSEHQLGFTGGATARKVKAPDLSTAGYTLLGGRLVPTEMGSACMFVYENADGSRISVFTRLMKDIDVDAPMRPVEARGVGGFAWSHAGIGYSLISAKPDATLHDLSNKVRDEMNART